MDSPSQQQMFNLKWNNFQSSISCSLYEQLVEEELVDVTLSAEGRLAGAHRVVLSACSPYFKQLFKTLPKVQHPVIVIRDAKFADLQALLSFIYQGEVQVSNGALPSLLKTAESLSIKGLTPSHIGEDRVTATDNTVGWQDPFHQLLDPSSSQLLAVGRCGSSSVVSGPLSEPVAPAPSGKRARLSSTSSGLAAPLNLSSSGCAAAAATAAASGAAGAAARFTLRIPSIAGVTAAGAGVICPPPTAGTTVQAGGPGAAAGSPQLQQPSSMDTDEGALLDWEYKEGLYNPPVSPTALATPSLADVAKDSSGSAPTWKHLLPKPTRRMLPVKCPECSKLISNAYNLRVHMDLHKDLTYVCSMCSTPTRSRDTLRKHITNIHKVKGEQLREMLDRGVVSDASPDALAGPRTSAVCSYAGVSETYPTSELLMDVSAADGGAAEVDVVGGIRGEPVSEDVDRPAVQLAPQSQPSDTGNGPPSPNPVVYSTAVTDC